MSDDDAVRALLRDVAGGLAGALGGPLGEAARRGAFVEVVVNGIAVSVQVRPEPILIAPLVAPPVSPGVPKLSRSEREIFDFVRRVRTMDATRGEDFTAHKIKKRLDELRGQRRKKPIGQSTLDHALAKLVKLGLLVNNKLGKGYGLGPRAILQLQFPSPDFPAA